MARLSRPTDPSLLAPITFAVLTAPYVIFFLGWLRWQYGVVLSAGLIVSSYLAASRDDGLRVTLPPWRTHRRTYIATVALVFVWVWLSGAGGFNFQSTDYELHNGRLKDLIDYRWPVMYPGQKPLVYYSAYYLPNALLGMATGFQTAYHLMLAWTVLLVLLAVLWSFAALGRASVWVVLAFICFSGMDVFGAALFGFNEGAVDRAEWWAFPELYLAYQSTTFQLFWAPQQVIVSWILTAMVTCAVINKSARSTVFVGSLACFWAPFGAMVLAVLVVVSVLVRGFVTGIKEAVSPQNLYGGLIIPALFAVYFFSGSAGTNPSGWLWEQVEFEQPLDWLKLILFYVLEIGVLVVLCWKHIRRLERPLRTLIVTAVALLIVMPAWYYGIWNDFLARGAVPCLWLLFFCALSFLFESDWQTSGLRARKVALVIVLGIGAMTPMASFKEALTHLGGPTRKPVSTPDHPYAAQYLGSTSTFFFRHLAAEPRAGTSSR